MCVFSSETWSGLTFILAVAVLQLNLSSRKRLFALAGLLLGFSFLCRFQSAFLIVGLLYWYVAVHKEKKKNICIVVAFAGIALLLGVVVDWWFYGQLVFTPWNYFKVNILQGVASSFGISPWHYYIGVIVRAPMFPIGCLILICLCILIYKRPNLLLLWIVLPFLFIHSIIPHKEERFLFPVVNFIPLMFVLGWQEVNSIRLNFSKHRVYIFLKYTVIGFLIAINVLGLIVMSFKPMGDGTKAITYYIHQHYNHAPVNLIFDTYSNPYNPLYLMGLNEKFYADNNIREINIVELLQTKGIHFNRKETNLFVFEKGNANYPDCMQIIREYNLKPITQSIPEWIEWLYQYDNCFDNKSIIMLYGTP